MIVTSLSSGPLDVPQLVDRIRSDASGARVVFEGVTRSPSRGRNVSHLIYEAHESFAEKQLSEIAKSAAEKWNLDGVLAVHRTGRVDVGEVGVVVVVTSIHRAEAFEACSWVIDSIKHQVAIWKKEFYVSDEAAWIGSTTC